MTAHVSRLFGADAGQFDRERAGLIPHLHALYEIAVDLAVHNRGTAPRVLDLGAGTGLFSGELATHLPNASIDLLDASREMLDVAARMLDLYAVKHTLIEGDLTDALPDGPYDIVVSALAIHHLSAAEQADLYRRVYAVLRPGGVFVNAEQVAAAVPELDELYAEFWLREVKAAGTPAGTVDKARERMAYDRPAPVASHLAWLADAGFRSADCFYKRFRFAVLAAWR
ncbi:methyltransferase domain-containing protein [Kitasatospora sp. NPDC096128]|uniref:class I SAM-dependent methyltransferase n=1 Tax=Kitasatospora sp. NPDC096128 TaxID=3155547 RepID=UPI003319791F